MASTPVGSKAPGPAGRTPAAEKSQKPAGRRMKPSPWWLTFLLIMVANWVLMSVLFPEPTYVTIPYTAFKDQVQAGTSRRS